MGLFFRRSLSLPGLRLNLTGRGLGVSTGVRGARIGVGTRGVYVSASKAGLTYRHYQHVPVMSDGRTLRHMELRTPEVLAITFLELGIAAGVGLLLAGLIYFALVGVAS